MKIAVFFPCFAGDPDEYTDANPFNLESVERDIAGDHPVRQSTSQVLAGPTDAEFAEGFAPVDAARIELDTVSLHGGNCKIGLKYRPGFSSYVDDLSELALSASIERTLSSLPSVSSVSVETR
jgi:hypothetical protein